MPQEVLITEPAIVLLCAHLEGFIEDLYDLAATKLLDGKVKDTKSLTKEALDRFRQPYASHIAQLFNTIGMSEILKDVSWRKMNNDSVKKKLADFVDLRNKIAHGGREKVNKARVVGTKGFVEHLANRLDEKVADEFERVYLPRPW